MTRNLMRMMTMASMVLLVAAAARAQEDTTEPYRVAAFGNSLMGNIRLGPLGELAETRGQKLYVESTGAAGAPMPWLWNAKTEQIKAILDKGDWDGLLLQPFLRPIEDDKAGARNFIDYARRKSPDIKVYIYAQFINDYGLDYQRVWNQDVTRYIKTGQSAEHNLKANRSKGYYEALTREIRAMYPDLEVVMVPTGHAFALLDRKIKAGLVPGIESIYELWADATHVNNFGSYLVGMTWYAALFGRSPVGLPIGDYQGDPDQPYNMMISPAQAKILQTVAWEVVASHPLSGVTSAKDPMHIATPAIHPNPVVGEQFTQQLRVAFGKAPYRWAILEGLPRGLSFNADGLLSGTPLRPGRHKVTFTVTDAKGAQDREGFLIRVEPDTAPTITTPAGDLGTVHAGELVKIQLKAEGGNGRLRWDFPNLRTGQDTMHGLRLTGDGMLVGAIGLTGQHEFEIRLRDSDPENPESDTAKFHLTVKEPRPDVVEVARIGRDDLKDIWVFMRLARKNEAEMSDYVKQFDFPSHPVDKPVAGNRFDSDARFQVVHNGSVFYAAVHVKDDNVLPAADNPLGGDSVEIFLDINNDREKIYNADDRHAIITADGQVSGAPGPKTGAGAMRTDDGYFVWVRMPAHAMKRKLENGVVMGFDVAVNDRDSADGPVSRVFWRGNARNAEDTTNFGTIILTDKAPE